MRKLLASAIISFSLATGAQAAPLTLVGNNPISGTTVAAEPQLAGTIVEDEVQGFSFAASGGTLSGSIQSRVVLSSVDNTYDFYWRIFDVDFSSVTGATSPGVQALRLLNLGVPVLGLSADYRTDGLGSVAPGVARTFASPQDEYLNFIFTQDWVAPGEESYFMFLDTNATNYDHSAAFDLVSGVNISGLYSTFGAAPPVPEPGSWSMMIGGLMLAGLMMRSQRRVAVQFG